MTIDVSELVKAAFKTVLLFSFPVIIASYSIPVIHIIRKRLYGKQIVISNNITSYEKLIRNERDIKEDLQMEISMELEAIDLAYQRHSYELAVYISRIEYLNHRKNISNGNASGILTGFAFLMFGIFYQLSEKAIKELFPQNPNVTSRIIILIVISIAAVMMVLIPAIIMIYLVDLYIYRYTGLTTNICRNHERKVIITTLKTKFNIDYE